MGTPVYTVGVYRGGTDYIPWEVYRGGADYIPWEVYRGYTIPYTVGVIPWIHKQVPWELYRGYMIKYRRGYTVDAYTIYRGSYTVYTQWLYRGYTNMYRVRHTLVAPATTGAGTTVDATTLAAAAETITVALFSTGFCG